jgi:hypothetical protein
VAVVPLGNGTVVAFGLLLDTPPVAPVAEMMERAVAWLVQVTNVPTSLTDGRAKHCWVWRHC